MDAAMSRLVETQIQMQEAQTRMQEAQEELRRDLRQIALCMARAEKRPTVDDEVRGEPTFPMGPSPPPPPPPLGQETVPTAPLITPLRADMGTHGSGPAGVASGPTGAGSGPAGVGSGPAGKVPPSPKFEAGEESHRPAEIRGPGLWQYEHFVKNGGHPFLEKLDAEEAFLWISSAIGVFGSMACPMEYRVRIITGAFQDEARIWWDSIMDFTFAGREPQDITWAEFRTEFDKKYFPPDARKKKEKEFQMLRQNTLTIAQYEARFKALERFALDLVPTKHHRIERFYEGLHYEIRLAQVDRLFATFGYVVRAAGETERVIATRPRRDHD